MNWLYYLLEANLYLAIFYAVYLLILRNETFYTANRWYLIITSVLAFVLPVVQIGWLKPIEAITQVITIVPNQNPDSANAITKINMPSPAIDIDWADAVLMMYALGITLTIILFTIKLTKLYRLIGKSLKTDIDQYKLIELDEQNTGFSFFNYLFIGKNLAERDTIITHEMVHIRQKHSADIVFVELLKIVNWFNPLVYMLQNSLKTVHEYIADEHTAATETDSLTYSSFLLSNAYGLQGPAATNSFFNYNLLKNRIVMLNKPRSGNAARLKYLMIMPLTTGMLCLSTLAFSKSYKTFDLLAKESSTAFELPAPQAKVSQPDTGFKLPAPDVVKNDFTTLTTYLSNHIKFPSSEINNTKFAGLHVSFDVDKTGEVGDVRLLAPAKNVLGNAAVSAFNTFSGKLNVKPGTYIVGVNFVTLAKNYVRFPEPSITKNANFIGTVTVLGLDAKQEQKLKEQSEPANAKKQNTQKLSAKVPEPKIEQIKMPKTDNPDIKAFNMHLSRNVRYPAADRDNKVTGRVFAELDLNDDNTIKDVKILRAPSKTLENEVARAIKFYKGKLHVVKSDHANYTIPISFRLEEKDGKVLSVDAVSTNKNENKNSQKEAPKNNNAAGKVSYMLDEVVIVGFL
ncbi:energy transducer TonB [Mucilaginibacter sp. JRF]|uniref:M56 family metallopeptidase n=1 Tax=Mucilaginibacter sp. JRF TaxID=2780088 RepID=UPI00187F0652|nr:M56 family metallopeptidase [Mucilaginibacter sp. JRF]MBE9582883.1 energy transducer TonB [Mucilaginibacter sp. JRF]